MADLNAALIAFAGVLVGGYFNNFLAEDFRRFRDSQALAGALAGELESHAEAIPFIKVGLQNVKAHAESGAKLAMPEWPVPNSPIFEANADKIGLLHPDHAKGVAYVYEQLRAFRNTLHQLSKHHGTMGDGWQISIVDSCLSAIDRAEKNGVPLVDGLKHHAAASYWKRPATMKQCVVGLLLVMVLVVATIHYSGTPERGEQCTTTLDNGALHTACK